MSDRSKYFGGTKTFKLPVVDNEHDTSAFREQYAWAVMNDDGKFAQFMRDFGVAPDDDTELLGRLPLTEFALADLRSRLNQASTRISACAVLAKRGTEEDLKALLSLRV